MAAWKEVCSGKGGEAGSEERLEVGADEQVYLVGSWRQSLSLLLSHLRVTVKKNVALMKYLQTFWRFELILESLTMLDILENYFQIKTNT